MEFFRKVQMGNGDTASVSGLEIDDLAQMCASIDKVLSANGDDGVIYCLWGEFQVHREVIRGGVRFSLPKCPNALVWTITEEDISMGREVVVHCTINREDHDPDFLESISQFMDDWQNGLARMLEKPSLTE